MHLNGKVVDFKAYITVLLSRFDTFLQCNVLVLKTISTAIQTQNYLNQTVQLYCKMKHCNFFLVMHLLKVNINIKSIGVLSIDYKTHSAVDAQIC